MTTRGTRIAALVAVLLVALVPKREPCSFPDQDCAVVRNHQLCRDGDVEPFAVWALEKVLHRDLGLAYSHATVCE